MLVAAVVFTGCKKDEVASITPSMITNLTATAGSNDDVTAADGRGTITLQWQNPTEGDYLYSIIEWVGTDGTVKRANASHFSSSYTIGGLYKSDGPYTFNVYTVSSSNTVSKQFVSVTATSKKVPASLTNRKVLRTLPLTASSLRSDVTDPSEGSINLFDGNATTFWHSNWHTPQPFPQHWWIDLGETILDERVELEFQNRNTGAGGGILDSEVWVSNDPASEPDADANWTLLSDHPGDFPLGSGMIYTTPSLYKEGMEDSRMMLKVNSVRQSYWMYAEFRVLIVQYDVFDPDKDEPED